MKPFYIGLSCLSNDPGRAGGNRALHAEGRRILTLLDTRGSGGARGAAAIAAESGGRPFFADRHADFNISHSRHTAAAAWSETINPASGLPFRTGCDIQYISPGKSREAVALKYYSPGENAYIAEAGGGAERIERFYRIWVLKECCLKAGGRSVLDMRDSPSFAGREGLVKDTAAPFGFFLYELGGGAGRYLLAVCRETGPQDAAPPPEIRWYSPALALKQIAAIGSAQPVPR
jgi:phosphopantetheinyl transferase (holo-ACP synthase)